MAPALAGPRWVNEQQSSFSFHDLTSSSSKLSSSHESTSRNSKSSSSNDSTSRSSKPRSSYEGSLAGARRRDEVSRGGKSSSFSYESSSAGQRREGSKGRQIKLPNSSSREESRDACRGILRAVSSATERGGIASNRRKQVFSLQPCSAKVGSHSDRFW